MSEDAYRVAVVGARRRRQGTGEYIAREFVRQGCVVSAIVGTTPATLDAARAALRERYGIEARGFLSLDELLARETVDIVAVCSPPAVHLAQLECAAAAGTHVLCEKPLWWSAELTRSPQAGALVRERAERVVDRFLAADCHLALNAQWPYTLESFRQLHPDADVSRLQHFRMWLSPMSRGREMLVDSGSHLLSMLWALAGPGRPSAIRVSDEPRDRDGQPSGLLLQCGYEHARGTAVVEFVLKHCPDPPRPAGYSINGLGAERHVELPGYLISFSYKDRRVDVPDPLAASVRDFVRAVRARRRPDREQLVEGMTQLHALVAAA